MKTIAKTDCGVIRQPKSVTEQESLLIEAGSIIHALQFLLFNWGDTIEVSEDDAGSLAGLICLAEEMVEKAIAPLPEESR